MDVLEALLAELPILPAAREDLRRRLAAPGRHYHGVDHVGLMWRRHLEFGVGMSVRLPPWHQLIACAIAFHDAVHDPRRLDNEAASAALWLAAAPALPPEDVAWVAGTIRATADHLAACPNGLSAEAWAARAWLLDLDLTPLGEVPRVFAANTRRLRRECRHLSDAEWRLRNIGFLTRKAAAREIYRSAPLRKAFDARARANIREALAQAGLGHG
ncbi:hypothetical protein [Sediminicoccus sp. KRV36]|uniref:hypothetical protein n=1 Tax=Sediminicoccus sp. KRV36 TaxID=3133721 RepID=UPI00200DA191|nr:hypothetical protein [Sediminicoccus rosea]UPY38855.1 hypothetical protein LHU95_09205 [Sediminicoccus rosea]